MELAEHIKHYRKELGLSQEDLAERIYVSRQSVSNWETGKTYPDIHTLLLLADVFDTSLDTLVKGDLPKMKAMINEEDRSTYKRDSNIFSALFVLMILAFIPLYVWLDTIGLILYAALVVVTLYYANRVEKHKKRFDTQTIREIEAFTEGVTLDEIEKAAKPASAPTKPLPLSPFPPPSLPSLTSPWPTGSSNANTPASPNTEKRGCLCIASKEDAPTIDNPRPLCLQ